MGEYLVSELQTSKLTLELSQQLVPYWRNQWSNPDLSLNENIEAVFHVWHNDPSTVIFTLTDESESNVCATAVTFLTPVWVNKNKKTVMALATVWVSPVLRGRGLGAKLIRHALTRVDDGEAEFSLFQTAVPGFYEKISCRSILNDVIDSTTGIPPFWDPCIMIYPNDYKLPNGAVLDLKRKGW